MRINLITWDGKAWYKDRVVPYTDIELFENNYDDIEWDVVAFFENSIIPKSTFRTKHTVLLSGEPPLGLVYPSGYLSQFEKVISCNYTIKHPQLIHEQPAEPIHVGRSYRTGETTLSYDEMLNLTKPDDLKPVSLMSSRLAHLPGHRKRLDFVDWIIQLNLPIDIYGKGRLFVDDKKDSLLPYMFHICIENDWINGYWTEKIADSIICNTVPIYYGCPDISKFFDERCMYHFTTKEDFLQIISKVMSDPVGEYEKKAPYLKEEKKKLLQRYNIIETINHCNFDCNTPTKTVSLLSKESFKTYKFLYYLNAIRVRRMKYKEEAISFFKCIFK